MKCNNKINSRRKFILGGAVAGITTAISSWTTVNTELHFNQPPQGLHFLFQGDSITDGNRGRSNDPNHIMGHGYAFAIASRIGADFPQQHLSFYNRGISGNKVPDLLNRWEIDTISLKPDVLSILIGINDVGAIVNKMPAAEVLNEFEQQYRTLLQISRAANPDILFVLGLPFVFPVGPRKENWTLWQKETQERAVIVTRLAAEFDAVLIDYPAVFDKAMKKVPAEYWIWDGIHPTIFGHELMAREWILQTSRRLKFLQQYNY